MRRATILLVVMGLAVLLSSAVALAASVRCDGGLCRGTNTADLMTGTPHYDNMRGFGGHDRMNAAGAGDVLLGGTGADTMGGGYGADRMYGESGNDTINGGFGGDELYGGPGVDTIHGEPGNDYIVAAGDREGDSIRCGTGTDTAVIDTVADMDRATLEDFIAVTSCERVVLR